VASAAFNGHLANPTPLATANSPSRGIRSLQWFGTIGTWILSHVWSGCIEASRFVRESNGHDQLIRDGVVELHEVAHVERSNTYMASEVKRAHG